MQDPLGETPDDVESDSTPIDLARAAAQAWLAAVVESSDDAIVSKDLDGVVTSWNQGAERIFGWTAAEAVGRPIASLIIPPDRQTEEPQILARLRAGERVDHFETVRVTKDGRLIDVSVTISPIRDPSGRTIGASKIARDVTLQKRFHHELQIARDAAEQARQLAERAREEAEAANRAKDHFLSVLSHELRTPLTPVLGAISLMEQNAASLPEELREQVRMMRRNVETEARLVDDLLDITRIARGKIRLHYEVIDAHAALRDAVAVFRSDIDEKGLAVTVALRARAYHVWADPGRFQQILLNLLSNAVKFTPPDGTIAVRTGNDNGRVRIEVSDSGAGIDPEMMPRLFRPFEQGAYTAARRLGGLGLGLSIVKSLVELHKASISATSEGKDRGSTFTLRMDTVARPAASEPAPEPLARHGKPCRVLVVEDHGDTRDVLTRLLRSFGCQVTAAASVREAVALADRQAFDLLLSDIGLPDGSGVEVMRHLKTRQNVPGIALTGFGQDEDMRRSREAGFETHLTKPVNLKTLHEAIRKVAR